MTEPEGEYEYRDRLSARAYPDRLIWFFQVPAMYSLSVIFPLTIWLLEVARLTPPGVESAIVALMAAGSLVGVPIGISTLVWVINRTGLFLRRRSALPRRNLRILYVVLAVVMCGLVQLTGALFGASPAGIFVVAVLLMEVLTARELATGPRLVEDADAQPSALT